MNICLFTQEEINQPLSLRDERGEHLLKILHKKEGDTFSAGIINGQAGKATITSIEKFENTTPDGKKHFEDGKIHFTFQGESDGKPLYPLKMIIGFPRPIQLKRLMRDMAGLGVCEIHLTGTELGEKSYLKSDLATTEAGYQMLLEGTVQAAGTHIPKLYRHSTLRECIDFISREENQENTPSAKFALDNIDAKGSLWDELLSSVKTDSLHSAVAAIGSERGWTKNERQLLEEKGFKRLSMGKRVLRTESAATVSASLILGAMGKLN